MTDVETTVVVVPGEAEPEPATEAVETAEIADAIVEVAEIEADRDIIIAEIAAEVATTQIEAAADERVAALELELNECRSTISTQAERISALETELLTRPQSEPTPSLPNPSELESVEVTPDNPEAENPTPPPEPVKKRPKLKWI